MEIQQIRYAQAVAAHGGFSKAAEALFVTQPTLSQQVRRLEEELGFPLFARNTRSVTVTDRGAAFLKYAAPLLTAYETLLSETERLREGGGQTLQIGILPTFTHLNVLDTVHAFQSGREGLSVSLRILPSGVLLEKLAAGQIDAAVANVLPGRMREPERETEAVVISRDAVCALAHEKDPLAARGALRAEDLNGAEILLPGRESSLRAQVEEALRGAGVRPRGTVDCPDVHSLVGMVRGGAGIGFLSTKVAAQVAAAPAVRLPFLPVIQTVTAVLYRRDSRKRDVLAAFADAVRRAAGDEGAGEEA